MFRSVLLNVTALMLVASLVCAQNGTVVKVDLDKMEVEVEVDGKNHVVRASSVTVIDRDGTETTIAALSRGEKVTVTFREGVLTSIGRSKKKRDEVPGPDHSHATAARR